MNAHPTAAAAGTIDVGGDLTVNRMGFGAMRITGPGIWGEPPSRDQAIATLRRVVELGVNFIDTADSYGPGVSETLIAEALYPYPDDLVIATKGGLVRPGPNRWEANGRPEHLREACEGSLRRLRLEQIPLYQFHRPDPAVPLAESIGAIVEMKNEGKIRHVGISNVSESQLREAQQILPDRVDTEQVQRVRPPVGVADRPVRAGAAGVPALGPGAGGRTRTRRWPRPPSGTARPSTRSCWPGCWPPHRRSSRFRAPAPPGTRRRTSPPRPSSWTRTRSRRSARARYLAVLAGDDSRLAPPPHG